MKVGDNKADFVNTYVEDYLSKHGTFDETVDAYMFNLMTLEVLDRVPFGTPLLAHLQKADQLPRYRSSQATEIIHDMQKPHPKVKEKYLTNFQSLNKSYLGSNSHLKVLEDYNLK